MSFRLQNTSWNTVLQDQFDQPYFKALQAFVATERKTKTIYPPQEQVFQALESLDFSEVKVVILGQDPYHGEFQANGLSFSVHKGVKFPPSLKNIFKELEDDLGIKNLHNGDLSSWAKQGVLLLNATLTVEASKAGSHQKRGWETFTDAVIERVSTQLEHVVFILWGSYAQKKGKMIDREKHLVLETAHPSPLSVYRGFYGSKPFSKSNAYLIEAGRAPIDWQI
ncbi:uracil-DNA glycosylase [Myroides sp. 1354]|uniref:uracil-DNA glycosylase n=1 Tax=unclassified Myroides TaxID=2642485 RepID=UPI002578CC8C|nr:MULTISPECIES: uracil-DNA glycosylase [unclassified Myroides]MDM1044100.1 uracil-DNA glycosylase [Myroides sp. R163-1]MDM1055035.1 uracil-DNA glycosylase [Myroides sp. 1354]MDM1068332.1 uracil-DNA glycosylase [Myroides sp. 1372]